MNRPDLDAILKPLKPFQLNTVEHAFQRLFLNKDSTSRFLVADEVGLGKTLVARGVIARTIDHLWNKVDRIDIVYICSNASIARANLPKLRVDDDSDSSFALATRLTMLAKELASEDENSGFLTNKLNFVSFTPKTSFEMGNSCGRSSERVLLYHLLAPLLSTTTGLKNLLQGNVESMSRWRRCLDNPPQIESGIQQRFGDAFVNNVQLKGEALEIIDRWFRRYHKWSTDARVARNSLIGKLRNLLAEVCLEVLEPDLVILDEFQRFKPIIETKGDQRSEAAELAQSLFEARAHDCRPVRTLLLSATPYKLYTTDTEIDEEDHYEDFLGTTQFLFGDRSERVEELTLNLSRFGTNLKRAAAGDDSAFTAAVQTKNNVENLLRSVMSRTERVIASTDHDSMVETRCPLLSIKQGDVEQFFACDALFQAVGDRDPISLWKSAPYLAHFMRDYKFNDRLDETCQSNPQVVSDVLTQHRKAFLSECSLNKWEGLDPANAKLRMMVSEHLDRGLWRLLWLPPTLPYWEAEGPFKNISQATKTLMFSAWNVVPDVVSAFLSYEAERRMSAGRIKTYQDPAKQQAPLLRFTHSAKGTRSRHRLLHLLMPCITLADQAHPLEAPDGYDRRKWVRDRVRVLLKECGLPNPRTGRFDERWEWVAPLILDPGLRTFLQTWKTNGFPSFSEEEQDTQLNAELLAHVEDLLKVDLSQMGRRPPGLVDLLTDVALGSPSVLALRCLKMSASVSDDARRKLATMIADSFWSLFNQPAVISLIRKLATSRSERAYWRYVLKYCRQGNLQSVLDEQWHLLWEQHSWTENADPDEVAAECAKSLASVVHPIRSRVHAHFLDDTSQSQFSENKTRIRTVYALRFGHLHTEYGEQISQDLIRDSFNSPFRPFVLASTSVGQEGLDFHPWCHRLVHWNLPGNPVDLEQREGRIHRYKGHALRLNVAVKHGESALKSWQPGNDLWKLMFYEAEREARDEGESDLVPHWIAQGEARVERLVPLLPFSREVDQFTRLQRQLAIYRVVFGQPRQEELLNLLEKSISPEQIKNLTINLTPPNRGD